MNEGLPQCLTLFVSRRKNVVKILNISRIAMTLNNYLKNTFVITIYGK